MRIHRTGVLGGLMALVLTVACDGGGIESPDSSVATVTDARGDTSPDMSEEPGEPRDDGPAATDERRNDVAKDESNGDRAETAADRDGTAEGDATDVAEDWRDEMTDGPLLDTPSDSLDSGRIDADVSEPQDIADAPCPTRFSWSVGGPEPASMCGAISVCIPRCAIRERTSTTPCGESACKPDEICMRYIGGTAMETGVQPGYCLPGPERTCAQGQDCCFSVCALDTLSASVDLEQRTMLCGYP